MKKIDKIKKILNQWKKVVVYIEDFKEVKKLFITWYTKKDFCWYTENCNAFTIPLIRCKYFKFSK